MQASTSPGHQGKHCPARAGRAHLTLAFADGEQVGPYLTPEQAANRARATALLEELLERYYCSHPRRLRAVRAEQ